MGITHTFTLHTPTLTHTEMTCLTPCACYANTLPVLKGSADCFKCRSWEHLPLSVWWFWGLGGVCFIPSIDSSLTLISTWYLNTLTIHGSYCDPCCLPNQTATFFVLSTTWTSRHCSRKACEVTKIAVFFFLCMVCMEPCFWHVGMWIP